MIFTYSGGNYQSDAIDSPSKEHVVAPLYVVFHPHPQVFSGLSARGGTEFFGGYVPHRFWKVGSTEQI